MDFMYSLIRILEAVNLPNPIMKCYAQISELRDKIVIKIAHCAQQTLDY